MFLKCSLKVLFILLNFLQCYISSYQKYRFFIIYIFKENSTMWIIYKISLAFVF